MITLEEMYFIRVTYKTRHVNLYSLFVIHLDSHVHSTFNSARDIELIKESTNDCEKEYPANCCAIYTLFAL